MDCQKHLFSLRSNVHYLNCASKAPLLKSAENAAMKALIREQNPVDISVADFFSEVDVVKKYFANLVHCHAQQVALIPSSSYGFSSVVHNISAKKDGHVLVMKEEFPSGFFALKRWCDTYHNDLITIGPDEGLTVVGANWNQKMLDAINKNTAIVLISSIHWMSGVKFDLNAIGEKCAAVGATFIVDGSQSVGVLPMDVEKFKIDALICAGYKWLFGPYSLGVAYISDTFKNGIPLEESWMNRTNARNFRSLTGYETEYEPNAGRYNVGQTSNFILMPILKEGLKQVNEWTVPRVQKYTKDLIKPLLHYLEGLGAALEPPAYFSNHLFDLKLPKYINRDVFQQNLAAHNVYLSLRGEYLRVSVHVFNDKADIQHLILAIQQTVELQN